MTPAQNIKDFGRRLRQQRERAGLSQRQLAEKINTGRYVDHFERPVVMSFAYVSRIESGDRAPSVTIVCILCDILDLDVEQLLPHGLHPSVKKPASG